MCLFFILGPIGFQRRPYAYCSKDSLSQNLMNIQSPRVSYHKIHAIQYIMSPSFGNLVITEFKEAQGYKKVCIILWQEIHLPSSIQSCLYYQASYTRHLCPLTLEVLFVFTFYISCICILYNKSMKDFH